ncbi:CocE/NonD family hydrolase [Paenibacillus filicis]|uniref:CocE/NonD family hydrolase n=1 Tax=Paenibacillus filicis TaxID=669464 RepID=A0ABU9DIU7_9BACL
MNFGGVDMMRKVPCVLRDGVTLYADIYRPAGGGGYPVLLMRQPYGRKLASTVSHAHPVWYASQGFMVVIQDVRGRGDSEGEFSPFAHEAEDGYDTVEWAASLPGSNGKVGMYGFSYQGATQWAAASLHPPHLTAIAPSMTAANLYPGWMYAYGSFDLQSCLPWAYQLARDSARRAGDAEAEALCTEVMLNPAPALRQLPLDQGHPVLDKYLPAYFDWLAHPEYDEYWARFNWLDAFMEKPIPTLHIGGWYDFLLQGTLQSFQTLSAQEQSPKLFHQLHIGPWTHIPWGRKPGGMDHGPDADGQMHLRQAEWFRYWLKDEGESGLFEEAPVRYFEPWSKTWKLTKKFPFPGMEEQDSRTPVKHLYVSGSTLPANGASGGSVLTESKENISQSAAPDVFVYDARLPMSLASVLPADRSVQQDRYEILVYTGDPLEKEVEILGTPRVKVMCQAIDGPTDLVAVLSVVMPSGEARFLSVGRVEVGRAPSTSGVGEPEAADILMRPLSFRCPVGSAIRLELTGSAYPLLLRHPNGIPWTEAMKAGAGELAMAVVAVSSVPGAETWIELPLAEAYTDIKG